MEDISIGIAFFAAAVGIVAIIFKYLNNEKNRRYAVMEKAIESGQPLPENFFTVKKEEKRSFEYFKSGIIFTFLGVVFWILFFLGYFKEQAFAFIFIGAFFTAFGSAFLLIGLLRRNQEKNEKQNKNE
ncbi:MAG: DUF6249 domain-containing protein [Paludibacter sp.]|nr:DUF6249 domain-containing protein [Paludibacter sp.]